MFDKEFYPTSRKVYDLMDIDPRGKVVLEPQAGKGNIVEFLQDDGAKAVIAIEKHPELRQIVQSKCHVIGDDFFKCTSDQISHVDMIVMNPPFSNAEKHILHAWEIAPEGCEIISLCNWQTIDKTHRYRKVTKLVNDYGDSQNLGDCFSNAERKTDVEVGLVKLFKPVVSDQFNFSGFFIEEDEEPQGIGMMPYHEVRALVNTYVGSVKIFDEMKEANDRLSLLTNNIGMSEFTFKAGSGNSWGIKTKAEFMKMAQKSAWQKVFRMMKVEKYVTQGVMADINRFIEKQEKYPFTMRNVYKMLEIIVGTRQNSLNRALVEAIDNYTRHTHENRFGEEGWKTNKGYFLNHKFIINNMVSPSWGGDLQVSWGGRIDRLQDLVKVLCNVTGTNYDDIGHIRKFQENVGGSFDRGEWYEWGFFEFKVFKKGTMHLKFKDMKHWELLNRAYGEIKGMVLPEKMAA